MGCVIGVMVFGRCMCVPLISILVESTVLDNINYGAWVWNWVCVCVWKGIA